MSCGIKLSHRVAGVVTLARINANPGRTATSTKTPLQGSQPISYGELARHGYLQTECDLSGLLYIATCNQTTWIPGALKSRFRLVDVRRPTVPELRSVVPFVARDIETEWGLASGALEGVPYAQLLPPRMASLRQLRRAMQSAIAWWLDAPGQRVKH